MRVSGDSQREPETTPKEKTVKRSATDFDRAMGAMMMEESDGSMSEHELVGGMEWPVRHGWFPQRCQITLDVALSKKSNAKEEVAACEPDRLPTAPTLDDAVLPKEADAKEGIAACKPDSLLADISLDDVAPPEIPDTTKKVADCESDRLPVAPSLDDVARDFFDSATNEVAACELDRLLAAPTPDDIALPKFPTTKEVAANEPDRLRLIVAPRELDRLMAF